MIHFSEEFLTSMINEHKLISASLGKINQVGEYKRYANSNGTPSVDGAISNLRARKVELEIKIDVLSEFLNG